MTYQELRRADNFKLLSQIFFGIFCICAKRKFEARNNFQFFCDSKTSLFGSFLMWLSSMMVLSDTRLSFIKMKLLEVFCSSLQYHFITHLMMTNVHFWTYRTTYKASEKLCKGPSTTLADLKRCIYIWVTKSRFWGKKCNPCIFNKTNIQSI